MIKISEGNILKVELTKENIKLIDEEKFTELVEEKVKEKLKEYGVSVEKIGRFPKVLVVDTTIHGRLFHFAINTDFLMTAVSHGTSFDNMLNDLVLHSLSNTLEKEGLEEFDTLAEQLLNNANARNLDELPEKLELEMEKAIQLLELELKILDTEFTESKFIFVMSIDETEFSLSLPLLYIELATINGANFENMMREVLLSLLNQAIAKHNS